MSSWSWLRGAAIGFPFGALPSGGAEVPTLLSYSVEKKLTKHPEEFGKGAIEGVAGPEAANNASFCGTLVPLLTLGIPTSATAAIMLASFQIFNLQPGPQLFTQNSLLVWTLIASLYVANVMLLALNLPMIQVWVKVLEIPRPALYSGILVFATLGVYSLSGSTVEVLVMYVIGALGFFMRRCAFPIAPVILGVILGPVMETQFRRALTASGGDATVFVDRPLTVGLLAAAVLALVLPYAPAIVARLRGSSPRHAQACQTVSASRRVVSVMPSWTVAWPRRRQYSSSPGGSGCSYISAMTTGRPSSVGYVLTICPSCT